MDTCTGVSLVILWRQKGGVLETWEVTWVEVLSYGVKLWGWLWLVGELYEGYMQVNLASFLIARMGDYSEV